jgi:hypothetical protein
MHDEQRDKPDELSGAGGVPDDDRVVSERVQPLTPAQPTVGAELEEADTIETPGQVGAPEPATLAGDDDGIRETLYKQPGSREQVPATEVRGTGLRSVEATTVLMERSGAEQIAAERVSMDRSGAKTLDAKSAQLERSGVVALGSEHTVLLHSSAVQVVAEDARLTHSSAIFLQTERATLTNSRVGVFMGTAEGEVRAAFTTQSAAVFGAAVGAVFALLTLLLTRGRRATAKH